LGFTSFPALLEKFTSFYKDGPIQKVQIWENREQVKSSKRLHVLVLVGRSKANLVVDVCVVRSSPVQSSLVQQIGKKVHASKR
jgi:hypothetical protein